MRPRAGGLLLLLLLALGAPALAGEDRATARCLLQRAPDGAAAPARRAASFLAPAGAVAALGSREKAGGGTPESRRGPARRSPRAAAAKGQRFLASRPLVNGSAALARTLEAASSRALPLNGSAAGGPRRNGTLPDGGGGLRNPFHPLSQEAYGAYAVVCLAVVIFGVGLLGNLAVMCLVCHNYYMRSISNALLANLAFWDFLVLFFCLPLVIFHELTKQWLLEDFISCKLVPYLEVSEPPKPRSRPPPEVSEALVLMCGSLKSTSHTHTYVQPSHCLKADLRFNCWS